MKTSLNKQVYPYKNKSTQTGQNAANIVQFVYQAV